MPKLSERNHADERFRLAVEAAPSALVMVDHEGKIVLVNSQTEKLFGYAREELMGKTVEMLVPESPRKSHATLRGDYLAHPQARPMGVGRDLHARRKDGRLFPVEIGLNPIATAEGTWILSSIVDTTFDRKMQSLGVLARGIAHDFNNLLGSILANTELALADVAAGSSPVEEIHRIRAVAIRAAEIVRELMIYAGQEETHFEPIDVSRLVEEMMQLLKVSISKHAVLKTKLGDNLPAVQGNASQVRQVVLNLMINASEAIGEKDGSIKITTSLVHRGGDLAAEGAAELPEDDYVELDVSDSGCGMTSEKRARVFDPFFTTKFDGRGLGLSVVHGIVHAHGGMMNVTSEPGKGSTFQVFFPCHGQLPAPERTAIARAADEPVPVAGAAVLLVEDEETLRLAVSKLLRKMGFSVIEAGNGSVAIDLLRDHSNNLDVILLDMTIPGASSREIIAEAQRLRPDAKVILTSAYSREIAADQLDAAQVRAFIRKPFQLSDLVQLLRNTLPNLDNSRQLSATGSVP